MAISLAVSILDLVKLILEPLLSSVGREVRRATRLPKTADTLATEMEELRIIKADMENAVAVHTGHRTQPTNEVKNWLERVDSLRVKVEVFQDAFQNSRSCLTGCQSCWSRYKLSKSAASNLEQVRQLKSRRIELGAQMVGKLPPPEVEVLPGSSAPVVGGAATLSELRRHLSDDRVCGVGIYGMGGIGKTTLLTKLNEELRLNQGSYHGFNLVIWVTVSKDSNIMKIQEDIGVRLNYPRPGEVDDGRMPLPPNESDRAKILVEALSKMKFLLLLDDLWDKLDLDGVGVPSCVNSGNGSKVVFTTRSEDVCARMGAQEKVKVSFLNETESWDLFTESCDGRLFDDPSIRTLAEKIVAKCGGLPLALVTVGRAMATSKTRHEWKRALRMLKDAPERLQGMEQVLPLLKFSFDRLEGDVMRSCLLYCCLFPEDQNISKEQLVEYWVGEGLLDGDRGHGVGSITHAREEGYHIIGRLQAACLLEAGLEDESEVRMHDAIREMAFWIAGAEFLPHAGLGLMEPPSPERWSAARRISLMWNQIEELPHQIPDCPNLSTLLINSTYRIQQVPDGFFDATPRLRVLDLSGSSLQHLPPAVGLLVELCYLNLSNTAIAALPREMGDLINLRQLDLMYTFNLHEIPCNAISKLEGLQALNIFGSVYSWDLEEGDDEEAKASISDLESLERLKELGITIRSSPPLKRLLGSDRLSKSVRFLSLEGIEDLISNDLSKIFEKMKKLRKLEVTYCPQLVKIMFNKGQLGKLEYLMVDEVPGAEFLIEPQVGSLLGSLRRLVIGDCHALTDLTWVTQLTRLEYIELYLCQEMVELVRTTDRSGGIQVGEGDCTFPKLKDMHLRGLTKLRRISERPLLLPSLKTLFVNGCPELKQLPFGPSSATRMNRIVGKKEWWGGLEWLQDDIKSCFSRCFLDLDRQLWDG